MRKHVIRAAIVALLVLPLLATSHATGQSPVAQITPPAAPETGPGSAEGYIYPGARMEHYGRVGSGYWLVEPTSDAGGSTPIASEPLPVILHLNGCCGEGGYTTPDEVTNWFTHLARQGHVIVAPVYADYGEGVLLESSVELFQEALAELAKPGHTPVDLEKLAVTAYSYGSPAALEYAATAEANGWPVPKAFFAMGPCEGRFCHDVPEIASLPDGLKAIVMSFDIDDVPGVEWPQRLFEPLTMLPESDRNYIELRSDDHGWPALLATHYAARDSSVDIDLLSGYYETLSQPDALATWGVWKVSSALFDCAFSGTNCEYALGSSDELTSMGTWSDGVPVRPLTASTDPIADWAIPAASVSPDTASFLTLDPDAKKITGIGFPQDLVLGPDDRMYVINGSMNRIDILDNTGVVVESFGSQGSGPGEFQFQPPDIPFFGFGDLAFASDGRLLVADTYNNRVQIFDANLQFVQEIGTDPHDRGMLIAPSGIALDEANGRFFVTSYTGGAVNVYSMDGSFIERWGTDGPGGAFFNQSADVAIAPDGSVYVAEFGRSRVHRFADDGTPMSVIGGNGNDTGNLAEPRGIALDADGNLYVAEYNTLGYGGTRVQVFSPEGEVIGLVTGPSDSTSFFAPSAVSILSDGSIYISDEQSGSIYRFLRTSSS